jgi:hypothetical protein
MIAESLALLQLGQIKNTKATIASAAKVRLIMDKEEFCFLSDISHNSLFLQPSTIRGSLLA